MLYPWSILSSTLALDQKVESLSYCQKERLLNGKIEQNEIIQFQAHQREFNLWKKVNGHYLQVVSQIQSNQDWQEMKVKLAFATRIASVNEAWPKHWAICLPWVLCFLDWRLTTQRKANLSKSRQNRQPIDRRMCSHEHFTMDQILLYIL